MAQLDGCQIPCLPRIADGPAEVSSQSLVKRLKRLLARPWNYYVKKWLKRILSFLMDIRVLLTRRDASQPLRVEGVQVVHFKAGDRVRVKTFEQIQATLNPWKELKGCAFLHEMRQFCGTEQRILQPLEVFLDERDYKVKKCRGVVLLEGVICHGTPVFGRCDRCCHLFWREEWLEPITSDFSS